MKHNIKKIKLKGGKDATKGVLRRMLLSFIKHGKLKTTLPRAKMLKGVLDSLAFKAKRGFESDKNVLLKYLGNLEAIKDLTEIVKTTFESESGGFVTITKLGRRQGDNADMAQVEWSKKIVKKSDEMIDKKKSKKNLITDKKKIDKEAKATKEKKSK